MKTTAAFLLLGSAGSVLRAQDDVEAVLKKFSGAASYAFKSETKTESDNERFGNPPAAELEGKFEREVGMTASTESQEIVRVGETTASRSKPVWRIEREEERGDRGGRGGPRMGFMGGRMFGGVKPPHEELSDLSLLNFNRGDKEKIGEVECDVVSAEITQDSCMKLTPFGRMAERMRNSEFRGTLKAFVNAEGHPMRIVIEITANVNFDAPVELKIKRVIDISDFGSTKVSIPEDVKKLMEDQGGD